MSFFIALFEHPLLAKIKKIQLKEEERNRRIKSDKIYLILFQRILIFMTNLT